MGAGLLPPVPPVARVVRAAVPEVRPDAAFWGVYVFTALLFFRPQDSLPMLEPLRLSEVSAIVGLAALVITRMASGRPLVERTPELMAVLGLAVVMLATAPFSVWPGGALSAFLDVYVKVALIFLLLVHSVRSPAMLRRLTWLIVLAMGYVAVRGVFDYARGVNLVLGGRLHGPVSGLMGNPNDFAMNMVTFLPFALVAAFVPGSLLKRFIAAGASLAMVAAIIFTKSRAGMLGLAVMLVVLVIQAGRLRVPLVAALLVGSLVAVPLVPPSIWTRLSSIVNEEEDETGSRASRKQLMLQGWETFVERPLTGVGAGQFKNYNPPTREVPWQETHNVLLQILAELGMAGGAVFLFLMVCPVVSLARTRRRLNRDRVAEEVASPRRVAMDAEVMRTQLVAATAGYAGWFTCAQFASIGYYWTFYYLLAFIVIGRQIVLARPPAGQVSAPRTAAPTGGVAA